MGLRRLTCFSQFHLRFEVILLNLEHFLVTGLIRYRHWRVLCRCLVPETGFVFHVDHHGCTLYLCVNERKMLKYVILLCVNAWIGRGLEDNYL